MNKKELINKISEENEQLRKNIELLKQESIRLESDIIKLESIKSDDSLRKKIQEESGRKERKERKERSERKCFRFRNILK